MLSIIDPVLSCRLSCRLFGAFQGSNTALSELESSEQTELEFWAVLRYDRAREAESALWAMLESAEAMI